VENAVVACDGWLSNESRDSAVWENSGLSCEKGVSDTSV